MSSDNNNNNIKFKRVKIVDSEDTFVFKYDDIYQVIYEDLVTGKYTIKISYTYGKVRTTLEFNFKAVASANIALKQLNLPQLRLSYERYDKQDIIVEDLKNL